MVEGVGRLKSGTGNATMMPQVLFTPPAEVKPRGYQESALFSQQTRDDYEPRPSRPSQVCCVKGLPDGADYAVLMQQIKITFPVVASVLVYAGYDTFPKIWAAVPKEFWSDGTTFVAAAQKMIAAECPYDGNTGRLMPVARFLAHVAEASKQGGMIAIENAEKLYAAFENKKHEITARVSEQSSAFATLMERKLQEHLGKVGIKALDHYMGSPKQTGIKAATFGAWTAVARGLYQQEIPPVKDGVLTGDAAGVAKALKITAVELEAALPGVSILLPDHVIGLPGTAKRIVGAHRSTQAQRRAAQP